MKKSSSKPSTKKTIVDRYQRAGGTMRELECGHSQLEPRGGRARHETRAICLACKVEQLAAKEAEQLTPVKPAPALENGLENG